MTRRPRSAAHVVAFVAGALLAGWESEAAAYPGVTGYSGKPYNGVSETCTTNCHAAGGAAPTLTAREIQVLEGMSHGRSNAEIGRELFLSEDTVKTHARRLFKKLGASDRAHAVALGLRNDLVA